MDNINYITSYLTFFLITVNVHTHIHVLIKYSSNDTINSKNKNT